MRIVLWLRRQLSTTNRPVRVGLTDGMLVMTCMLIGMVITTAVGRATMPSETNYTMLTPFTIGTAAVLGLIMGGFGCGASADARSRVSVIRDWTRTIGWSVALGIVLPFAAWLSARVLLDSVPMVSLLEAFSMSSPMGVLMVCRSFGLRRSSDRIWWAKRTSAQL